MVAVQLAVLSRVVLGPSVFSALVESAVAAVVDVACVAASIITAVAAVVAVITVVTAIADMHDRLVLTCGVPLRSLPADDGLDAWCDRAMRTQGLAG